MRHTVANIAAYFHWPPSEILSLSLSDARYYERSAIKATQAPANTRNRSKR